MQKMLREHGGELELRMEKIKGGKLVIDHETNTFKVVAKDGTETTDHSGVRPIDANAMKAEVESLDAESNNRTYENAMKDMLRFFLALIDEQPTIEPEVRHGRWIVQEDADGDISFVCSECGRRLRWDEDFCPSCGSDMRTADTKD